MDGGKDPLVGWDPGQEQGLAREVREVLAVEVLKMVQEQDDRVLEGVGLEIIGTDISHPRHAENPKPLYPLKAREKGYKGEVLLKVEVLSNGLVGQIEVKRSSGHEILDQSALLTVRKWKFIPANKGGVAIPAWVNIPVRFELQ